MIPKIETAPQEDDSRRLVVEGFRDTYGSPNVWAVDFTATYARELHKTRERLLWYFPELGVNRVKKARDQLITAAMNHNIVFIYIHKIYSPQSAAEKALVAACNEHFAAERKRLAG